MDHIGALESRVLAIFLIEDSVIPHVTNKQVVEYLAWCGQVLLDGVFPLRDFYNNAWEPNSWRAEMAGQSLAGGLGAAFSSISHDEKARKETHHFKQFYSCTLMCESCTACQHSSDKSPGNFRSDAGWRPGLVSDQQYLAQTPVQELSPWASHPGWRLSRSLHDLMHCCHLGFGKDFTAQLIYDLCRHGYEAGDGLQAQLSSLWLRFRKWCKRHGISHPKRKLSCKVIGLDLKSPNASFPELNSRTKAAHVKPLIHFLAWRCKRILAVKFRRPSDEHAELRAKCAYGLSNFLYILDCSGVFLDEAQATEAVSSGRIFLLAWQTLAVKHLGTFAYKVRPKHHYFEHLLMTLRETRENPRILSNFADEDFMGKIVKQARHQHRRTCVQQTVALYVLCLRHRWRHAKFALPPRA